MKKCCRCGEQKQPTEFYKNKNCKDGLDTRCKLCSKASVYAWRLRHGYDIPKPRRKLPESSKWKKEQLDYIRNVPCMDCQGRFPSVCMDFDHVGSKSFGIMGHYRDKTWEQLLDEITKCEVVCSNCHRIRTASRRGYSSF